MASSSSSRSLLPVYGLALLVMLLMVLVYGSGLNNGFIFDDDRLFDGVILNGYGESAAFNWRRWLSYSSFIWLGLSEAHGPLQRGVNLALHLLVAVSLYALWVQLLALLPKTEAVSEATQRLRVRMAAWVAVAVFALNPVAVYAVAYLIQRSIVMATLFSVLACACMVRGLVTRQWWWHLPALLAYVLAVMSKEHALMLPLAAVVLVVYVARPSAKQLALVGGVGAVALLVGVALMWSKLGNLVGAAAIDEASGTYLHQLNTLFPGFADQAYGLSVLNQAALFFKYGALWLVPNPQWLSIDLRPAFPLAFAQMPQLLGALAFVALGLVCVWALFTKRGAWALVAACVLGAQLLFVTEFAMTWLQDPFVLYRSYLWAMFLPGLLALGVLALIESPKAMLVLGGVLAVVLAGLSFERVQSMRTAELAWADAAAKVDLQGPVNAVGRWRPVLNHGAELLRRESWPEAIRAFDQAEALGEPFGTAAMNKGVALQNMAARAPAAQRRALHTQAVAAFQLAEKKGMAHEMLPYHLAISLRGAGQLQAALPNFERAAKQAQDQQVKLKLMQDWAEAAVQANQVEQAESVYDAMLAMDPSHTGAEAGKGLLLLKRQQPEASLAYFDAMLLRKPQAGPAHYGRAMALMGLKDLAGARAAAELALANDRHNTTYQNFVSFLQRQGAMQ